MSQRFSSLLLALSSVVIVNLVGCGPGMHPVQGKVTLADGKPGAGSQVVFERQEEGKPITARGDVQTDGSYELSTNKPGDGVPAGKYRVQVNPPPMVNAEAPQASPFNLKYSNFNTSGSRWRRVRHVATQLEHLTRKGDRSAERTAFELDHNQVHQRRALAHPASGFAIVGLAARVKKNGGKVSMARIGVTGMGPRAFRDTAAEKLLESGGDFAKAAAVVGEGQETNSDLSASGEYRRHLARVHAARALAAAISRAS